MEPIRTVWGTVQSLHLCSNSSAQLHIGWTGGALAGQAFGLGLQCKYKYDTVFCFPKFPNICCFLVANACSVLSYPILQPYMHFILKRRPGSRSCNFLDAATIVCSLSPPSDVRDSQQANTVHSTSNPRNTVPHPDRPIPTTGAIIQSGVSARTARLFLTSTHVVATKLHQYTSTPPYSQLSLRVTT
jgi:hypothetical protein